jgi:hypothetical protein
MIQTLSIDLTGTALTRSSDHKWIGSLSRFPSLTALHLRGRTIQYLSTLGIAALTNLVRLRLDGKGAICHLHCVPSSVQFLKWGNGTLMKPQHRVADSLTFGVNIQILKMRHVSLARTPNISNLANLRVLTIRATANRLSATRLVFCFRNLLRLEEIDLSDSRLTAAFVSFVPMDALSSLGIRPCLRALRLRAHVHPRALEFLTSLQAPNLMLVDLHQCEQLQSAMALEQWSSLRVVRFSRFEPRGRTKSIDLVPALPLLTHLDLSGEHQYVCATHGALTISRRWPQLSEYIAPGCMQSTGETAADVGSRALKFAITASQFSPCLVRVVVDIATYALHKWRCIANRSNAHEHWLASVVPKY